MRQRDWIVIGLAIAVMVAGIGIGLAICYSRASRRPPGPMVAPHQQRSEQGEQATAKRAKIVRQQRAETLRSYERMSPEQQRQFVQDQVRRTFEPNQPPRRIGMAVDQNEVVRQILEKVSDMTPDQRREYLRTILEQERARLAGRQGTSPNLPAEANSTAVSAPPDIKGQERTTGR